MADFCKQCSEEDFGADYEDLKGLCPEGGLCVVVCEGCGLTHVDHTGKCLINCFRHHDQITCQFGFDFSKGENHGHE